MNIHRSSCLRVIGISILVASLLLPAGTLADTTLRPDGYSDLTVQEAWAFLTNESNGIQIPIDVRRDDEWKVEHIDTPAPENPIHYPLTDLQDPVGLQIFLTLFEGKEIILYCRTGSRSVTAANILLANNFSGIIYNMLGGITAWTAAGLPTEANQAPSIPDISGSVKGKAGVEYTYSFYSVDPDGDDVFYCLNWSDGSGEICVGPYASGDVVEVSHSWSEKGTYVVQVKARDVYDDESDWGTLTIQMPRFYPLFAWAWLQDHFPVIYYLLTLLF
ncbi:MAG: PKD domain-containing protein [Candidatus Thermoplasmatota archaeon]|nr:PKD domain-containing protein [Candidatus Thermoplasmatota archaeon]